MKENTIKVNEKENAYMEKKEKEEDEDEEETDKIINMPIMKRG